MERHVPVGCGSATDARRESRRSLKLPSGGGPVPAIISCNAASSSSVPAVSTNILVSRSCAARFFSLDRPDDRYGLVLQRWFDDAAPFLVSGAPSDRVGKSERLPVVAPESLGEVLANV